MTSPDSGTPATDSLLLQGSRELDARVAKAMGEDMPPSLEYAKAKVGWRYISSTGNPFILTDGRSVVVPRGDSLRLPEGSTDWNDRYTLWLTEEHLGEAVAAEVEAYRRMPAMPFSTDIAAAWRVVEWWASRGAKVNVMNRYAPSWGCNIITEPNAPPALAVPYVSAPQFFVGSCASAPVAICRATLEAMGVPHHAV